MGHLGSSHGTFTHFSIIDVFIPICIQFINDVHHFFNGISGLFHYRASAGGYVVNCIDFGEIPK